MGGGRALLLVSAMLASAGCAKGQLGGGSNTSFGVGQPSSTTASSGKPSDPDSGDSNDDQDDGEPNTGDTSGGLTNQDTCGPDCGELCGNGVIDAGEDCDGADLGGMDCVGLGLAGGTLACSACSFDTSACADAVCGDGIIGGGEACDCAGGACTAAGLGNRDCTSLPAPTGGNYSGGTLACSGSCALDDTGCWACGDGEINEGEECDGGSLNGATCQSLGYDEGSLSCSGSCTYDPSACVDWVCGNGVCEPNEDSCNCADCPDDPNSCSPCQCGTNGGFCWCDQACLSIGDCCPNGPC